MKFAEHLGAHITPEWRKQYIQYEEMKALLYACMEQAPSEEVEDAEAIKQHFGKFEEKFFKYCDKELLKINTFFAEKLAEANRRFSGLKSDLVNIRKDQEAKTGVRRYLPRSKQSDLKLAFSEFYLSLILLQNYQNLNFTGFRKILKKHDKLLRTDAGAKWREDYVETAPFNTNKDINKLISETEGLVTRELEDGDRGKAMKRLRVPPLGEKQSPWTTFKLGLFMGSFCVLSVVLAVSAVFVEGHDNWRIPVRLYRGPLMIIITTFLLGINIYGWRRAGVNHVLIFELDPRKHMSDQQLMEVAAFFGVLWTLSALLFVYSPELSMPKYCHPLILACCMLLFLLNPLKICLFEARMWFLRIMARIIAAPFCHVNFADFWLADQLNSLVPALLDIEYMICFYSTNHDWTAVTDGSKSCIDKEFIFRRPLIAILPAWFRFAQCLRRYR
ncbi:unnamed protein product [Cyprideis torosa]|nr:unnamed protein product [Cyprideis torosa]CAG0894708.1 unnamed protein product [Cyprideis torosa]